MGARESIPGEPQWDGEEDAAGWPGLESLLCDHCGQAGTRLLRCSRCRGAFFCNRSCQQAAWPQHREVCGARSASYTSSSAPGSPAHSAPNSPRQPGSAAEVFRSGLEAFGSQRFREALEKAEEAAVLADGEGKLELRCEALRLTGQCLEQLSDLAKAKEVYADALKEARTRLEGPAATKAEASILLRLGAVATKNSKPGIAAQYQRKAISLMEADGRDKDVLAAAYNNLGISASKHGHNDGAKAAFERAVELRKETGNVDGLCACSCNLANLLRTQDNPEEAAKRLEDARQLAHDAGNMRLEHQVLLNLANMYENEMDENETDDGVQQGTAADVTSTHGQQALQCRRRLFGLPELPKVEEEEEEVFECGQCGSDLRNHARRLRCGRCRRSYYCNVECQRKAWKEHAAHCRGPRAPSAAEKELETRECSICYESLQLLNVTVPDSRITILECLHCLHTSCYAKWADSGGGGCPVCRNSLGFSV